MDTIWIIVQQISLMFVLCGIGYLLTKAGKITQANSKVLGNILVYVVLPCVIAKSFARIFYRNAINIGMPILECEAAAEEIAPGDEVRIDFDTGVISDLTTGKTYQAAPFPAFIQNIIQKGGLLASLKEA